jgi:hypothetical protein
MTVSIAMAFPEAPLVRAAEPSGVPPTLKETEPVGGLLPDTAVTEAVKAVVPADVMAAGLAVRVAFVPTTGARLVHPVTRL